MFSDFAASKLAVRLPSPIEPFTPSWQGADQVSLFIKRDDLIHPIISGNKWRKLKYALDTMPNDTKHIVSFGGGYSNHLHACGYLCHKLGLQFTAIVRGDYSHSLTPMLKDLHHWNTNVEYVNKLTYKRRNDTDYLTALRTRFAAAYIIPEGGSQRAALKGMAELVEEESSTHFNHFLVPVASGATLAGLAIAITPQQSATGIAVLKGQGYLESLVKTFVGLPTAENNWYINHDYQCGGYAKTNTALQNLCDEMTNEYHVPVEPVYSGKVFLALKTLLARGHFARNSRILVIHTGGLQGLRQV
ncbi:pyridoxal-phosphate dependent enzyme [Aestuariibacter sp. A3R04]|nr:pyridoxal-phosphate dependent enzyme [Aestuariibacter sp. A3R04]MBU3021467.1 pyridoxal-phosphate dependent enzyme [Aestuariibacter sp. A3R04]